LSALSTYTAPHGPQSRCTNPLTGDTNVAIVFVGRTSLDSGVTLRFWLTPDCCVTEHCPTLVEIPRLASALRPPGTEI